MERRDLTPIDAPFLHQLLTRLDPAGILACSCGRQHPIAPVEVVVGGDALARSAELLARRYGPAPVVWALSDGNTEAAAGARWKGMLGGAAIRSHVLPAAPRPVPSLELAGELTAEVKAAAPDVLVAVGGGVICDLVKRVALDSGVPSVCIATAPSVDAYSSATAALRVAGYHQSTAARSVDVIVCDLDVLGRAPRELVLAGLGDLLAKLVAALDWRAAHLVTGEPYCATIAELALESARVALRAARALATDRRAAIASLTDALLVSGFVMQAWGGSRPAASSEHTIAHFWETTHAVRDEALDLHGILVGAATALVLPGYRALHEGLRAAEPDLGAALAAAEARGPGAGPLEDAMQPFAEKIAIEARGRSLDRAAIAGRIEAFARHRAEITGLAEALLAELTEAVGTLAALEFPFSADRLGIPEPLRLLPVRNVRLLRDRYTSFDLAHELGREAPMLEAIAAACA